MCAADDGARRAPGRRPVRPEGEDRARPDVEVCDLLHAALVDVLELTGRL
ncbi:MULTISPECIES: hypothetical protein [Streptomycetaceae]|nr:MULTISPECIES: hypothetical protein [Streptomycetaceae]MCX4683565.1 hypothetical protein [Kitasatospora purpeofusca]MEE1826169.1 hypothetical protein [Streptomyces sp. BE20]WTA50019.1 hypothetical protein OIP63_03095 [Kitasatospora purpeofusca]